MEEFELKDEQQEESVKTTLAETDLELDDAEKKPLMQATREKVEAIADNVKEGAAKAFQFVKNIRRLPPGRLLSLGLSPTLPTTRMRKISSWKRMLG